jgi:hypothetical protein
MQNRTYVCFGCKTTRRNLAFCYECNCRRYAVRRAPRRTAGPAWDKLERETKERYRRFYGKTREERLADDSAIKAQPYSFSVHMREKKQATSVLREPKPASKVFAPKCKCERRRKRCKKCRVSQVFSALTAE